MEKEKNRQRWSFRGYSITPIKLSEVQPYSKADATLLVIALRYLADQVEKKNGCALAVKALSKTIEFPELEEVEKVRKATEGLSKESE